jgi:hypothetical protein
VSHHHWHEGAVVCPFGFCAHWEFVLRRVVYLIDL